MLTIRLILSKKNIIRRTVKQVLFFHMKYLMSANRLCIISGVLVVAVAALLIALILLY
jgi:hypothetical protein